MDADADCIGFAVKKAPGVHTAATFLQRDIIILRYQQLSVISECLQFCCHATRDNAIILIFSELPVWTAFAGRELAVAIVDEDFHGVAGLVQLTDSVYKGIE